MPPRLPCIAPGLWNRLAYPAAFLKPGFSQKCQFDGPNLAVDNFTPKADNQRFVAACAASEFRSVSKMR